MKYINSRKQAFTLIELLVVIAIIAILAAILFPVFAQAKKAAKKTTCLSNIKQIATATVMYGSDNDDMAPSNGEGVSIKAASDAWSPLQPWTGLNGGIWGYGGGANAPLGFMDPGAMQNWGAELYPYIKSMDMYVCSSAQNDTNAAVAPVTNNSKAGKTSYVFNGCMSNKSLTAVSKPADQIAFQGRATTVREAVCLPRVNYFPGDNPPTTKANDSDDSWIGFTHDKGDNYAYADGHAKFKMRNAVTFKSLGYYSWVWGNSGQIFPDKNPTMQADPTKGIDNWGTWGDCDPAQVQ